MWASERDPPRQAERRAAPGEPLNVATAEAERIRARMNLHSAHAVAIAPDALRAILAEVRVPDLDTKYPGGATVAPRTFTPRRRDLRVVLAPQRSRPPTPPPAA
mmetsp:Transcript_36453/g.89030  ORF Transcript_36453/g.89030 Transcript_36453/m.89030 type:complete len:104 (+) Transcript_36453:733-1044(+)|eukprot:CAMPEP_0198351862 /NCGR_PEP_ID=MMETSP1450-20131203/104579_1 /TAXON_ID=753684 ORGANISM="Madagascaria erythrocladiodes, Strain CCMP3234" /NCGR_SAMPLE_ID=MMETSP1450 /ASSEMBLY_ACC=CAM_ASM_001115 /LENGTH=103 /DNA_ID=CAMNT_0044057825 /DNA_START=282 /DNA_END=593 /DNA_ORIENTATION=-